MFILQIFGSSGFFREMPFFPQPVQQQQQVLQQPQQVLQQNLPDNQLTTRAQIQQRIAELNAQIVSLGSCETPNTQIHNAWQRYTTQYCIGPVSTRWLTFGTSVLDSPTTTMYLRHYEALVTQRAALYARVRALEQRLGTIPH